MIRIAAETPWYDLFSRGARDWLRHNEKVRDAVKDTLPELLASSDLMTGPGSRSVAVPVKFLEHARLRLAEAQVNQGAGQGRGEPGDVLQPGREEGGEQGQAGGTNDGEVRFVVELSSTRSSTGCGRSSSFPSSSPSARQPWIRTSTRAKAGTSAARARASIAGAR